MEETKTFSLYKVLIYSSIAVILWFVLAFLVVPNFQIIYSTFFAQGEFTLEPFQKIFSSERAVDALKNSFILGFTLPFTTAFVGIMQVLFIEYFDIKGQKFLTLTYMIPLIFGGLLINNGYLFVYGPNGLITEQILRFFPEASRAWFQGYFAVLLVMSFGTTFNYMVFFRNQIKQLDYQTIQAAKNLGASQFQIITKVILPPLRPVLGTILVLSFQSGLGAFAAPLMVGGPNYETISPLILTFAERPSSRVLAAILALILGVFQVLLLIVIQRNEKKMNFLSISKVKTKIKRQKISSPALNIGAHILAYIFAFIHWLPFLAVFVFSFTDYQTIASMQLSWDSFTLQNYARILTDSSAYSPFITSVIYSFLAAAVVGIAMTFVARLIHKWNNLFTTVLEYLLHIPWLLPSILFALGLILSYSSPSLFIFGNTLTGSWIIMLIAYIAVMFPNTLRFLKAALFSVDSKLEDAAKNLGASGPYTFFKVVLPAILPTFFALFALNFNGKLADYNLSVFLYNPLNRPLGVVIRNNSTNSTAIDAKAINLVYSVLLVIISGIVMWFVYFGGKEKLAEWIKGFKKKDMGEVELENELIVEQHTE